MKGRTTSAPKKIEKASATKGKDSAVDTSQELASGVMMEASGTRSAPTHEQIALRAYQLYLARGSEPGHDAEDWLAAEAELLQ